MAIQVKYNRINEILGTNTLRISEDMDLSSVGLSLLSSHMLGAPVVDGHGKYLGFINESDLIKVLNENRDLNTVKAREVMNTKQELLSGSTSIDEAVRHMQEKHLHNLPVVRDGLLVTTITRHDLLRVLLDVDLGIEK
jgi:CBS domain-containing protein